MDSSLAQWPSSEKFIPHGMCYLWQPDILALHIGSDLLIALAYFSVPFTLLYFVRKRDDLQFNWMFVSFAVFIVACGMTHLMEIWVIWHPDNWLDGSIKAVTALASVPTAILLAKLVPTALRLPSPAILRNALAQLENEVVEHRGSRHEILGRIPGGYYPGGHGCCSLSAEITECERVRRKICPLNKRGSSCTFPRFQPLAYVQGIFGDPQARGWNCRLLSSRQQGCPRVRRGAEQQDLRDPTPRLRIA